MLKYIIVTGLCYGNETVEDMDRREKMMREHNARMDALEADWKRQRELPMPAMRQWASDRGLIAADP